MDPAATQLLPGPENPIWLKRKFKSYRDPILLQRCDNGRIQFELDVFRRRRTYLRVPGTDTRDTSGRIEYHPNRVIIRGRFNRTYLSYWMELSTSTSPEVFMSGTFYMTDERTGIWNRRCCLMIKRWAN